MCWNCLSMYVYIYRHIEVGPSIDQHLDQGLISSCTRIHQRSHSLSDEGKRAMSRSKGRNIFMRQWFRYYFWMWFPMYSAACTPLSTERDRWSVPGRPCCWPRLAPAGRWLGLWGPCAHSWASESPGPGGTCPWQLWSPDVWRSWSNTLAWWRQKTQRE